MHDIGVWYGRVLRVPQTAALECTYGALERNGAALSQTVVWTLGGRPILTLPASAAISFEVMHVWQLYIPVFQVRDASRNDD